MCSETGGEDGAGHPQPHQREGDPSERAEEEAGRRAGPDCLKQVLLKVLIQSLCILLLVLPSEGLPEDLGLFQTYWKALFLTSQVLKTLIVQNLHNSGLDIRFVIYWPHWAVSDFSHSES